MTLIIIKSNIGCYLHTVPARLKLMCNVGLSGRFIQNTLMTTLILTRTEITQKKINAGVTYKYSISIPI